MGEVPGKARPNNTRTKSQVAGGQLTIHSRGVVMYSKIEQKVNLGLGKPQVVGIEFGGVGGKTDIQGQIVLLGNRCVRRGWKQTISRQKNGG